MRIQNESSLTVAFICGLLAFSPPALSAQTSDTLAPRAPTTATRPPITMRVRGVAPRRAGIGDVIYVEVDSLREAMQRDSVEPQKFVLYLNGHPIWNVRGELVDAARGQLEFRLAKADTSEASWVALLGRPRSMVKPGVSVGVGYGTSAELASTDPIPPNISLTVIQLWRLVLGAFIVVGLLLGFLWLAIESNMIRDAFPPFPPKGKDKPYSLSRLQMAVWFFLVFVAFVFLNLITHSVDTLNGQALLLMGIGTATALGSVVVDNSKQTAREAKLDKLRPQRARLEAEIAELQKVPEQAPPNVGGAYSVAGQPTVQLAEKQATLREIRGEIGDLEKARAAPISTNFLLDILSDDGGISLHRFQMLAWTIILGAMFLIAVWERLAMPEFSVTLLSLMGISAGTYLGFKVPEKGD